MTVKPVRPPVAFLVALASLAGAVPLPADEAQPVEVYAATGVAGALEEIAAVFQKKTGTPVHVTSGGSLALSRQILQGAPADIFVPEGPGALVPLLRVSKVNEQSSHLLATNTLVVAARAGSALPPATPEEIAGERFRQISIADPDATTAGIHAKHSLMSLHLWERLGTKIRISPDVKKALASVESGEADLGIAYATDVRTSEGLAVVLSLPETSHGPIQYIAAFVARPGASRAVRPFLEFLRGPEARKALLDASLTPAFP